MTIEGLVGLKLVLLIIGCGYAAGLAKKGMARGFLLFLGLICAGFAGKWTMLGATPNTPLMVDMLMYFAYSSLLLMVFVGTLVKRRNPKRKLE